MSDLPYIEMAHLKLTKSVFTVNSGHGNEEQFALGISLKNSGDFIDDGRRAIFSQYLKTVTFQDAPFFLEVEFEAVFILDPPPMPLERPHCVNQVFPRIVFPYMREYVAETTRRGGFMPLLLNHSVFDEKNETRTSSDDEKPKWMH